MRAKLMRTPAAVVNVEVVRLPCCDEHKYAHEGWDGLGLEPKVHYYTMKHALRGPALWGRL